MNEKTLSQEWLNQPERGSLKSIKLGVWIALRLGRPAARLFLYPICLYFVASSATAARNSRAYLTRSLNRKPRLSEVFRHFLTFASCALDRVFLLNEQLDQFDIRIHNEQLVREIEQHGRGCILVGAHFGSFEAARAIGRVRRNLPITLLMYEENAKKIRAAMGAINPRLETEVIGLGRMDSMIMVSERLERGHFIGVLADRHFDGKDLIRYPFLGASAAFPKGPFRVALLLQRPIVMMFGVYRGGAVYDVYFELLSEPPASRPPNIDLWLDGIMRRYVERLEFHCRDAPYNWFNFYDFWA